MKLTHGVNRRQLIQALALAAAMTGGSAMAQAWPSKPISLIVPFPAGGTTDVLARALAEKLSVSLGQTVIVESKPGAGATLGADFVAKARPDGYTLLVGAVHHTIASSVYKKLPYDFQKDLAPITVIAMVPNVLVVNPATPAKNVAELVALLKAKPGVYNYGSNGNGTAQHLIGTQFENLTGTDIVHIPYKGSGPLVTDLLGGQVTMSFDTVTPVLPHIKAGKLRDILARLNAELVKVIQSPEFRKRMEEIGAEPIGNSADQMSVQIRNETEKFAKLVKAANVTIE